MTSKGELFAPVRYKEIVRERYYISKHCNTSYNDIGEITPTERAYLLEFIEQEMEQTQKAIENQKQNQKSRKR